jgi:hypothetical protein
MTDGHALSSPRIREWRARLGILASGLLAFETLSGLAIWLLPFSIPNQFLVLTHTAVGVVFLAPFVWYQADHWWKYKGRPFSHYMLTGYVACGVTLLCCVSGVVLTWDGFFGTRMSRPWHLVHLVTTLAIVAFTVPHVVLIILRDRRGRSVETATLLRAERRWVLGVFVVTAAGFALIAPALLLYRPVKWVNEFPADYRYEEGASPFRPSLATTASGGAYDDRSLTGSASCGTMGCHEEIYREWNVSAHRWASMDPSFQAIQEVMAKQNGPETTRYCGGCHDPASLFAGQKSVLTENLSSLRGYQEGVSCLVCHSIRETDLRGNANYTISQPEPYAFEVSEGKSAKVISDFLIRAYPAHHVETYSKRLFKTPEYCAACHKQFIDEEVNQVGWVQLQNQYDNWRKSKWNPEGKPELVVECRECHMPLSDSRDPAAGDEMDSYRSFSDGKHRDHRFIAANSFIPRLLEIEGWEEHAELTQKWLRGERPIPEIEHKWTTGPAVKLQLFCPDVVRPGEPVDVRVVVHSNKVGHDFPTGPLDIIQSWIRLEVTDEHGALVYSSGDVDEKNFIEPGTFMFKAEPVDRYGALIDRHNLWEMVGVRFRRSLFPGFSEAATYTFSCPSEMVSAGQLAEAGDFVAPGTDGLISRDFRLTSPAAKGELRLAAHLDYRKVDQYLLNFMFGEDKGITSPIVRMVSDAKTIRIEDI